MAGYRDREVNFLAIDGTAVATGSDQEDNVDLSNYGVSMGNFMGMRIWKVESDIRVADALFAIGVTNLKNTITIRTITSGSTEPLFNDDGVIAQKTYNRFGATTSGGGNVLVEHHGAVFPKGLLIVSDKLYQYFDNDSGATIGANSRVWFTLEKMSESDWREAWEVWRRA